MKLILPDTIISRDYGDLLVLHNRATHDFFRLDDVGVIIFRGLLCGKTSPAIEEQIREQYAIPSDVDLFKDITNFIKTLNKSLAEEEPSTQSDSNCAIENDPELEAIDEDEISDYCAEKLIPYTVTWELTHSCNLKCIHCFCPPATQEFWTEARISSALNELRELGTMDIEFTGGECLTHPLFEQTMRLAYEKGFMCAVLTNGVGFTKQTISLLEEIHPRCVQLSIYSLDPKVHDKITGVEGSHKKTMSALTMLRDKNIRTHVACTILKKNVLGIPDLVDWAEKEGVSINFGFKLTASENPENNPDAEKVSSEVLLPLLSDPRINPRIEKHSPQSRIAPGSKMLCQGGFRNLCLSATGEVYPCNSLRYNLGFVSEKSIKDIWTKSPALSLWRHVSISDYPECLACSARSLCNPCPASLFGETKSLDAIHPDDCRVGKLQMEAFLGHQKGREKQ